MEDVAAQAAVVGFLSVLIGALPVRAAALTEVKVDLSFVGDCHEVGTAGFYVDGVLHHQESVMWGPERPLDLFLFGDINADGPFITLHLSSKDRGTVFEADVPQVVPPFSELYSLDAQLDCTAIPYVLDMPDTSTDPLVIPSGWLLAGLFAVSLSMFLRKAAATPHA